jgi:SAM-dependent methyltransferase
MNIDMVEYLRAKEGIDNRSINRRVWTALKSQLADLSGPIKVLDLGCGTASMLRRLLDGLWQWDVEYTGVDHDPELLQAAPAEIKLWAEARGFNLSDGDDLKNNRYRTGIRLQEMDVYEGLHRIGRDWSLVLANAFLDQIDLPTILPQILGCLQPKGLFYFTLNFDGATHFFPIVNEELDRNVIQLYHRSMDERLHKGNPAGHSQTGRRLLKALRSANVDIIASKPSDWFIYPQSRSYPDHERLFLRTILRFVEHQLDEHPELDQAAFREWLRLRTSHVEVGELLYVARQIDVAGRIK